MPRIEPGAAGCIARTLSTVLSKVIADAWGAQGPGFVPSFIQIFLCIVKKSLDLWTRGLSTGIAVLLMMRNNKYLFRTCSYIKPTTLAFVFKQDPFSSLLEHLFLQDSNCYDFQSPISFVQINSTRVLMDDISACSGPKKVLIKVTEQKKTELAMSTS